MMLLRKVILVIILAAPSTAGSQVVKFINAKWLIDGSFQSRDYFSVDGIFQQAASNPDTIIDLKTKFIIPPFGDAHTHNLDGTRGLKEMISRYIADGVFYVQVLGNYNIGGEQTRKYLETDKRLEVNFANALLTCTYGHGFYPYEPIAMGIYAPYLQLRYADSIKKSKLAENKAYYFLDSEKDVDDKWSMVKASNPDIIKIVLNDAANYIAKRKLERADDNGLSEQVAAYVVQKAHAEGLRVFAHVETADDARLCAKMGVDGLAHLPGYFWDGTDATRSKYCMNLKDVKLFAKKKMIIIPTFNINGTTKYDGEGKATPNPINFASVIRYKKQILAAYIKAGGTIALGADYFGKTVEPEIDSLIKHKVFSNFQLIDIYSRQTSQAIFPGRKIGELKPGFEASFLVLDENPLDNIEVIKRIKRRFKKGVLVGPTSGLLLSGKNVR